jgi:hypothetical protein
MLTARRLRTFEKFATFGHFVENQNWFSPFGKSSDWFKSDISKNHTPFCD